MRGFDVRKFHYLGKKIIGAGLNYKSLLKELKATEPKEPIIFQKPTSSYLLEGQLIQIPEGFQVNNELELGVIIGEEAKDIHPSEALNYVGGYCLALDLTAMNMLEVARKEGLPWLICKGFDTACPISTAIPSDGLPNPNKSRLWCCINDEMKQDGNTCDMIFTISDLMSFISKHITLEPYDLILTGSPAGVGPICEGDEIEGGLEDVLTIKFTVC